MGHQRVLLYYSEVWLLQLLLKEIGGEFDSDYLEHLRPDNEWCKWAEL